MREEISPSTPPVTFVSLNLPISKPVVYCTQVAPDTPMVSLPALSFTSTCPVPCTLLPIAAMLEE
jgi:hypothetical protein